MGVEGFASQRRVLPKFKQLKARGRMQHQKANRHQRSGIGQLTLVEHALCPLDARRGLVENLVQPATYRFSDAKGRRQSANAKVFCPLGLSSKDEFYLWGLLALTMTHCPEVGDLQATPHWCLRQLGIIDAKRRRGGRQYQQFAKSLRRLSTVRYLCDNFYDPMRAEHRQVSFGFLSYSLPQDPKSSRAWRIAWDPVFFELVSSAAGHFRFDLESYRGLDAASRRLFLFACKIFSRRSTLPPMSLSDLAVNLLGFAPTLSVRDMKVKVDRCIKALQELEVVELTEIVKIRPGEYRISVTRGNYFARKPRSTQRPNVSEGPLWETLVSIGFESSAAGRLLRRYPHQILTEWADITQAAQERFGRSFFRKSPMAFLVDSVSKAAKGNRTPPDWWQRLRKKESNSPNVEEASRAVFVQIRDELFGPPQGPDTRPAKQEGLTKVGAILETELGER